MYIFGYDRVYDAFQALIGTYAGIQPVRREPWSSVISHKEWENIMVRIFGNNPEYSDEPVSDIHYPDIILYRIFTVLMALIQFIYIIWFLNYPTDVAADPIGAHLDNILSI